MKQTLTIADINIAVNSVTDFSRFFGNYENQADSHADFEVGVSEAEIRERHRRFPDIGERGAESYLIYEKICDELPRFDAFMLHAATLCYGGKAYAFCAKSGTGKSTHAELWKMLLGDRYRYINGDKPIIRILNGVPTAFGTPWNGKEGRGENISAPLAGICFLVRSETPSIRKVDAKEGLFRVLSASHRPKARTLDNNFYRCIERIVETVPMYELSCDISESAARLSFETMTGEVK